MVGLLIFSNLKNSLQRPRSFNESFKDAEKHDWNSLALKMTSFCAVLFLWIEAKTLHPIAQFCK